jgi:hypothetical protein
MSKKLVLAVCAGAIAIAVAIVVYVRRDRRPHHRKADVTQHATGIDRTAAAQSILAMDNAPELATPCETAYGAIEAEQSQAKMRGTKSLFEWVAPKADFLAACRSLPDVAQKCMAPRYRAAHDSECVRAKPPEAALKKMFVPAPLPPEPELP